MYRLIKGISWIFTGNIVAAFSKWLILILIARVLTPNDVGVYSLAFALTAPIALFVNLKLRSLFVTDKNANFSDFLFTRNLSSFIALIIIAVIGLMIYPEYLFILLFVGLNKIFDLHSEFFYSLPHLHQRFNYIGKLMIVKHIILISFFTVTLYFTRSLLLSLVIQVTVQIVFLYLIEKKLIEKRFSIKYTKINFKNVKKIIGLGIPLGLSLMIVSLNSNFPRYVLEYLETEELLGYFSAIAYIVTVGNLLMRSVSQNFLPILASLLNKNEVKKFKVYIFGYLPTISAILGISIILASYLFGDFLLTIVYGVEYAEYLDVLILMAWAVAINFISWNFDTALMSMRYINIQPKIAALVLIVSVFLSIFLVNEYGIYGAAFTIIVTNVVQLLLRAVFVIYGLRKYN